MQPSLSAPICCMEPSLPLWDICPLHHSWGQGLAQSCTGPRLHTSSGMCSPGKAYGPEAGCTPGCGPHSGAGPSRGRTGPVALRMLLHAHQLICLGCCPGPSEMWPPTNCPSEVTLQRLPLPLASSLCRHLACDETGLVLPEGWGLWAGIRGGHKAGVAMLQARAGLSRRTGIRAVAMG